MMHNCSLYHSVFLYEATILPYYETKTVLYDYITVSYEYITVPYETTEMVTSAPEEPQPEEELAASSSEGKKGLIITFTYV